MGEEHHKIKWTDKAKQDVKDIYNYYVENANEIVALMIVIRIAVRADILYQSIYAGQKEPFLSHLKKEYRRLVISNYKIIYSIHREHVSINAVFDARQNPKKIKVR